MALACGDYYTAAVAEDGRLWACGNFGWNDHHKLGRGTQGSGPLPLLVGSHDAVFDGEGVLMVAAGGHHTACVTGSGKLWTWGHNSHGQLGLGTYVNRKFPVMLSFPPSAGRVLMVSCGRQHTLALTATKLVWSCGCGLYGRLGHDDEENRGFLRRIHTEGFEDIVMIAAGSVHSMALKTGGAVWTWGRGNLGQLGRVDQQLGPAQLPLSAFDGVPAEQVAAGQYHSMVVAKQGALWAFGSGAYGQLGTGGMGDSAAQHLPVLVGAGMEFGSCIVVNVACGDNHTMAITKGGVLWTFGDGLYTGHNLMPPMGGLNANTPEPKRIDACHFGGARVVSVAGGPRTSAAATDRGTVYTWGHKGCGGHRDGKEKARPTLVDTDLFGGARIGRAQLLPQAHALAFAMGTHARLGRGVSPGASRRSRRQHGTAPASEALDDSRGCVYAMLSSELMELIVKACFSAPEGSSRMSQAVLRTMGCSSC